MSQIPLYSDEMRMRRHIRNLNLESDYDSEYANHPPPTDSEIERIYPGQNGKSMNRNNNIDPTPDYRTEEDIPVIHRNSSYNRLHNNNHQIMLTPRHFLCCGVWIKRDIPSLQQGN